MHCALVFTVLALVMPPVLVYVVIGKFEKEDGIYQESARLELYVEVAVTFVTVAVLTPVQKRLKPSELEVGEWSSYIGRSHPWDKGYDYRLVTFTTQITLDLPGPLSWIGSEQTVHTTHNHVRRRFRVSSTKRVHSGWTGIKAGSTTPERIT